MQLEEYKKRWTDSVCWVNKYIYDYDDGGNKRDLKHVGRLVCDLLKTSVKKKMYGFKNILYII